MIQVPGDRILWGEWKKYNFSYPHSYHNAQHTQVLNSCWLLMMRMQKKRWRGECSNINSKPAVWRIMTLERKKALFALIFWKRIKAIMQELTVKISDEKKYTFWNSIWLKVRPEGLLSNALCKVWSLLRKGWLIDK